jgi:DNA-binding transcriptional MerR regulator
VILYDYPVPNETEPRYTLTELADLAGVTARTVRYYISQGLLAVDASPGPGPKYDDTHLARLRLIKRLQREHQPLADIRRLLASLDDAAVLAIAAEPADSRPTDSALDYIRRITSPAHHASERTARYLRDFEPTPQLSQAPLPAAPPPAPDHAARLERSQWERLSLAPDVELHIRRPLPRSTAKRVDRLIEIARDLLSEDQP